MRKIFKKKWIIIITLLVIVGGGIIIFFNKKNQTETAYATYVVKKGTISAMVSGTGQVSGKNQVNITPLASGKISSVNVKQGDRVKEGQIIAIIDETNAISSLNQAKAALETAKANYNKLISGPTELEIKQAELSITQSKTSLKNSYIDLLNNLNSIYISVFNNIHNNIDQLFDNPNEINPTIVYTASDAQAQIDAQNGKLKTNDYLSQWQKELNNLNFNSDPQQIEKTAQNALNYLNFIKQFLNRTLDSLITAIPSSKVSSSMIDSYRNSVSAVLTSIQQNISSLSSSLHQIENNKNSIMQAELALEKLKSPPTEAEIQSAKAAILNAENQIQNAQTIYDNNIIRAPFSGEIAVLNIQKGSLITGSTVAGTTGSTVIGTIVADQKIAVISLNEIDVAKIKIGDRAILTFDALPNQSIEGKVAEIEGVGAVNQGVVNYNIKISFDPQDLPIKSGMSVTANIITQTKENVLIVPNEAIKTIGGKNYVEILDPQKSSAVGRSLYKSNSLPQKVFVEIGISNETTTEIIKGLNEGDVVITKQVAFSSGNQTPQSLTTQNTGGRSTNTNQNINFRMFHLP